MTQLRCPINTSKMFGILKGESLIEVSCQHCRKIRNSHAHIPDITAVLHLYDINGQCVETEIVRAAQEVAS